MRCYIALMVCALVSSLSAADFTFNAPAGDNVWTTNSNWEGGSAPGTNVGGSLFITAGNVTGGTPAIPITGIDLAYTNIDGIEFTTAGVDNTYGLQGTGSFTLNNDASIVNNKTSSNTISVDVIGTGDCISFDSLLGELTFENSIDISDTGGVHICLSGTEDITLEGVISGSGGSLEITMESGAAVILSAANTFTGGIELNQGSLNLGNAGALGTGTLTVAGNADIMNVSGSSLTLTNNITINNGRSLRYNDSDDLVLNGVISGDGQFIKDSNSDLTLSGSNTYAGGTTFRRGTILLANNSALGTGTLSVTGNATVQAALSEVSISNAVDITANRRLNVAGNTNSLTMSGVITGFGSIRKNGTGTLTLIGQNAYSGGTDLRRGTLIAGNNNALGTGTLTVNNDAALEALTDGIALSNLVSISNNDTLTLSGDANFSLTGVISGLGDIVKLEDNTVTLSGTNTYSGGTTLTAGTLILGNNTALGTDALTVNGNATLQSDNDSRSVSNNITLNGGTTLTVSGSNNLTLSGVISSTGALTQSGTGTLTMSGTNTYTGATTVNAGTVIASGSFTSAFTIGADGTLAGAGTITGDLNNSGTISPGTSPGTLSVTGTLTFNSGSTYDMEIASTAGAGTGNDLIDVTGGATLAGTLNVISLDTYSPTLGDTFTIIQTTTGITGTFDTVTDNLPAAFGVEQSISGNNLVIEIVTQPLNNTVTARNLVFAAEAFERIRNSSPTGDIATVLTQLETLSQQQLEIAFEHIVPNYLVTQSEATYKGIDVQNNNITGRIGELRYGLPAQFSNQLQVKTPDNPYIPNNPEQELIIALQVNEQQQALEQQQEIFRFGGAGKGLWSAWVSGFGTFGDFDPALSQAGYEFTTAGVTFGFDYRLLDTLAAGAFAGYSNTGTTVDGGQGSNYANTLNTGIYMTWFNEEGFFASGLVGGGVNFYENNRRIVFGNIDRVAESSTTGFYIQTLATGGYQFKFKDFAIGPQLALQYINLQIGSHSESGADSLDLDVGAFNGNSFVTRLGFRSSLEFDTTPMLLVPEIVGFWQHEYLSPIDTVTVGVPAGTESFAYTGIGPSRDSGLVGVNLIGISHDSPLSFTVQYNAEFVPNQFVVNNVFAGIRITF